MAQVNLTGAAISQPNADRFPSTCVIDSWRMPGFSVTPSGRWCGLYGYRDAVREVMRARADATARNCRFAEVLVTINAHWVYGSTKVADFPNIDLLPVDRLTVDTLDYLIQKLDIEVDDFPSTGRGRASVLANAFTHDVELINRLWELPELSHLKIVTWKGPKPCTIAAVRSPDCIDNVVVRGDLCAPKLHFG